VAYNTECNTRGDTYKIRWIAPTIDPRRRTDRPADQILRMYFIHRVDVDPKPAILKTLKAITKDSFFNLSFLLN